MSVMSIPLKVEANLVIRSLRPDELLSVPENSTQGEEAFFGHEFQPR